MSDLAGQLLLTIQRLSGLEARIADVLRNQDRIETKLDDFVNRLAKVEANYEHVRTSVRNEIMADIKAELATAKVYLDLQARGLLPAGTAEGHNRLSNGQASAKPTSPVVKLDG